MGLGDFATRVRFLGAIDRHHEVFLQSQARRNDLPPDQQQGNERKLAIVAVGQAVQNLRLPSGPVGGRGGIGFGIGHGPDQRAALHQQTVQTIVDGVDALSHLGKRLLGMSHGGLV